MTLAPLPSQPQEAPWPTDDWPTGALPFSAEGAGVRRRFDYAFSPAATPEIGETHALLIVRGGRLIAERYAEGHGPEATCHSWSMAKSITHALAGILVGDGKLDIHAGAGDPQWGAEGDPRGAISLDHLLRMSSGLAFVEEYDREKPSDVVEMLFGKGQDDVARFAAAFPLEHPPGTFFSYSSGTTNIVSAALSRALGATGDGFAAFMQKRLFEPLGMKSPMPKFDAAGTFIGSSYCFAAPRDFARFGLLYLRDGVWEGRRILPAGWVDYARTPTFQQPSDDADASPYGAHWWLDLAGPGSFQAAGYDGQFIVLCPDRDLILVRHGVTPQPLRPALKSWLKHLAALFAPTLARA